LHMPPYKQCRKLSKKVSSKKRSKKRSIPLVYCRKIAFDSNILIAVERVKADVFSMARQLFGEKVKFVVTRQVKDEMKQLQEREARMQKAVKVALIALRKEHVRILPTKAENADLSLIEAAKMGYCIATNDIALRKRIKEFGVAIIYLSRNRFLKIA